jgi:hypothetical protein
MEPTQFSETLAFNTQTPGKYPEDNLLLQQHGESLKTRTLKLIANEVKINRRTVHLILTEELGMSKICAKMVSRNLTEQRRDERSSAVFDIQCVTVTLQPPYSPDLAPCEFFLFQKLKSAVKGHHFESTEDIQNSATQVLNDIPQTAFQECYKRWQHRWNRCVQA